MFAGNMMFLLLVVAAMILLLLVSMFVYGKKRQEGIEKKGQDYDRNFTEDDRQAVLLIRELDDIIREVKEAMS